MFLYPIQIFQSNFFDLDLPFSPTVFPSFLLKALFNLHLLLASLKIFFLLSGDVLKIGIDDSFWLSHCLDLTVL